MDYMEQALALAKLALGQVSPNPAVGAVVVKDDTIIGQGYTQPPGSCHAEVMALSQAGQAALNATMYVTLEPCSHYGRTPPCTEAIKSAGISEVHMSMHDPNPLVSGRGQKELEKGGIKTFLGEFEEDARRLNEAYAKFITTGRPFVIAKFAMSLDGKIATKSGDSKWITGIEARKYVHSLRYTADAIMAGANTVRVDDPQLTCRCCGGRGGTARRQPMRVIVDGKGSTPCSAQIFGESGKTLLALGESVDYDRRKSFIEVGAEIFELKSKEGLIDLDALMGELGNRGITSILVEGGGALLGSLFDAGLVDKVIVFIAPIIIGGDKATTAVGGSGVAEMADALRLEDVNFEKIGDDFVFSGYVKG